MSDVYTHDDMMRARRAATEKFQKVGLGGRPRSWVHISMKFKGEPLDGPVFTDHVLDDGTYFINDNPSRINEDNYNPGIFYAVYSDLHYWREYLKVAEKVAQTQQILDDAVAALENGFVSVGSLEERAEKVAAAYKHYNNKKRLLASHVAEKERLVSMLTQWGYDVTVVTEDDFKG